MARLGSLCVYCASSDRGDPAHRTLAANLGRAAAERDVEIVFGGGRVGLMGVVADAALAAGGRVTGVIPRHLEEREVGHRGVSELLVVETMHERKQAMFERSDAFCILPGGLGTLEETFEVVTWKLLGLHDKPIVLVNQDGYWDPLLDLVDHLSKAGYVSAPFPALCGVASDVPGLFQAIEEARGPAMAERPELI